MIKKQGKIELNQLYIRQSTINCSDANALFIAKLVLLNSSKMWRSYGDLCSDIYMTSHVATATWMHSKVITFSSGFRWTSCSSINRLHLLIS